MSRQVGSNEVRHKVRESELVRNFIFMKFAPTFWATCPFIKGRITLKR
jgi:hypothetical protein